MHKEIFLERCYDINSLPSRPLVADVGANIGLSSVFVKRCYPDAEIFAFEPVPHTAAVLRQNIRPHQLADMTVHKVALGNRSEHDVPFTYFPRYQEAPPGTRSRSALQGHSRPGLLSQSCRPAVPEQRHHRARPAADVTVYRNDPPRSDVAVRAQGLRTR